MLPSLVNPEYYFFFNSAIIFKEFFSQFFLVRLLKVLTFHSFFGIGFFCLVKFFIILFIIFMVMVPFSNDYVNLSSLIIFLMFVFNFDFILFLFIPFSLSIHYLLILFFPLIWIFSPFLK